MPREAYSVMLWTLKGEFEKKLEVAAAAGCQSVELVGEHLPWDDAKIASVKKLASSLKLRMDTISCTPNWGRDPVSMLDPAQRENFLKQVSSAMVSCQKLEIPYALLMSGNTIAGKTFDEQYASMVEGAKRAADIAAKAGITLIFEPLNNRVDHKGFFLDNCVTGTKACREVNHPNVGLLFDIYHEQVQIGNVTRSLDAALPFIKVVHIADNPGRHEPGTGEMNYNFIYKHLKAKGYSGMVTMEFIPTGDQQSILTSAVQEAKRSFA